MAKGSIFKEVGQDGTVSWRVRVDMLDPKTGKRRQPQRTYKTKREAQAGMAQWVVEIERGTAVVNSRMTVGEYITYWLDTSARHRVRATTLESYEQKVRLYIVPGLGSVSLQRLNAAQVQAFYSSLLQSDKGLRHTGLSTRTVRYVHAILHRALKEAVGLGLVSRNVTESVAPPKSTRPPIKTWDVPDVQRFLAAVEDDSYSPVWLIALYTGMRRGELLGLRWQDVDLAAGVVHVRQGVVSVKSQLQTSEPKTASGRRTIALDPLCVQALREHRQCQNERRLLVGPDWRDHDLVFANNVGSPIDPNNLYHRFVKLVKATGVQRIPFHGLRHTHATLLMQHGVHPKVASERLGHANISLTLQTYSHVLPQMQQEAAVIFAHAVARNT